MIRNEKKCTKNNKYKPQKEGMCLIPNSSMLAKRHFHQIKNLSITGNVQNNI